MYIATNEVALHISAKKHVGGLNHHVIIVSGDSLLCLLWVVYYDQLEASIVTNVGCLYGFCSLSKKRKRAYQ